MSTEVNHPVDLDFVLSFAMRWGEAWVTRDAAGLAALCTEDIEVTDPALGTVRGRAAVEDWLRGCERAFPDYRFDDPEEPPYLAPDSPKAIVLWRMLGTHSGPIEPPGIPPTNRSFVIDGVDHWTFRDGLVSRCRAYWDLNDFLRQLGLAPSPP